MSDEINCDYTPELVCPYCGYEHYVESENCNFRTEWECFECEKQFDFSVDYDVTFCSTKKKCSKGTHEYGDFREWHDHCYNLSMEIRGRDCKNCDHLNLESRQKGES